MSYDTLRCYSLVLISSVTCLMPLWGLRDGYSVLVNHFHEINLGRIIQQLMNFIINLWKRSCRDCLTHRDVGQCQVKCTVRPISPHKICFTDLSVYNKSSEVSTYLWEDCPLCMGVLLNTKLDHSVVAVVTSSWSLTDYPRLCTAICNEYNESREIHTN